MQHFVFGILRMSGHGQISTWATGFTTALIAVFTTGCALSAGAQKNFAGEAQTYIQVGDWERAYRTLEDALGSTDAATRLAAYDLIVSRSEIKRAADKTFSNESLAKTFEQFDIFTANELESVRLSWYSKFASDDDLNVAKSNLLSAYRGANERRQALAEARRTGVDRLVVDEAIFRQLAEQDQGKFKALYPTMTVLPVDSVGTIRTHQIIDKSMPGSNAGTQLGSAVAQAAYIDRSISRYSYSALGQLSAGLLGGVIGSSFNTSPQSRFLINYGVELRDGTIKGILKSSVDGISAPTGQCVFTNDLAEAPRYLCNDSLIGFIDRARRQNSVTNATDANKVKGRINCKIDVVGTIQLGVEDCRRLNGSAVE